MATEKIDSDGRTDEQRRRCDRRRHCSARAAQLNAIIVRSRTVCFRPLAEIISDACTPNLNATSFIQRAGAIGAENCIVPGQSDGVRRGMAA